MHLEKNKIGTRPLFAGNLLRHPLYKNTPKRTVGSLNNSDYILNHTFWIGLYPGLNESHLNYVVGKIKEKLINKN